MRVLVRTPNWLGDIVMALPVFAALRAHFAGDVLAAGVPRAFAPLLSAVPAVDQVVPLHRAGRRGWRAVAAEADALRRGGFDLAVLLPNSFGAAWAARRAGIPERWGFAAQWRRGLLTRAVPRPGRRTAPLHRVAYYQELVRGLEIDPVTPEPRLAAPPHMIARARSLLDAAGCGQDRPIVGIAPGAAYGYARRWVPGRYGRVADRLCRELGASVVLLGNAHDRDAGHAIESSLTAADRAGPGPGVVNLIGRTDLSQLIGVVASCRAFISSDSGAMHLAAALGVPVTAIFGPTDERVTGPVGSHEVLTQPVWCRPCLFRDCPIDHRCMTRTSDDRVFQAVAGQLATRRLTPPG
ncbi:MAG: lipopolysaccharide heptosyltransferase II [Acidobacteria bacterium]|nr:MAG: lipopolysaccharide heptosyltransferase II [Acidobacteriota bacterium]